MPPRGPKPAKPYKDFPLFPHAAGVWAKKIHGKLYYFGPWGDWKAALEKYQRERDDLQAGRTPRPVVSGVTVKQLVNQFMAYKGQLLESGEIAARTYEFYRQLCHELARLTPETVVQSMTPMDFLKLREQASEGKRLVAISNFVRVTRMVFKYAYDMDLIDKPVKFGPGMNAPSRERVRMERQAKPKREFSAEEIRSMLKIANPHLKAMILLGINCGFGQNDCSMVPMSAFDLKAGVVTFPRPKTSVHRRVTLWPETIKAIKKSIADRPKIEEHPENLFVTTYGNLWVRITGKTKFDAVNDAMLIVMREIGIRRPGRNFYALRHTFQTVADGSKDPVAVQHIMGHAARSDDMGAVYRERVDDDRLKAVTDFVRTWLFSDSRGTSPEQPEASV